MSDHADILRRAVRAAIEGDVAAFPDLFTADVSFWGPLSFATSLDELSAELTLRDDAFSDVEVAIDHVEVNDNRVAAEWVTRARFTGPFAVDDGTVIEPTGGEVILAGATFGEITDGKLSAVRSYFDAGTLLEQLLVAEA